MFFQKRLHLRPLRDIIDKLDLGLAQRLGTRTVRRSEEGREHVARRFVVCKTLLPRRVLRQKRPITMSKETYYNVKRDLLQLQKRAIQCHLARGVCVKRDQCTISE